MRIKIGTICLLILGYLLPVTLSAQDIKVRGQVTDQTHEAIEAAVVMLIRPQDNRQLEYCITDKQGFFSLKHGKAVVGQLLVRHISYATATISLPEVCDTVLDITLMPAQYEMEEVNVKGKRIPIQFKDGDWIINAENFISPGTDRSIDVLKKIPGIVVDEESKYMKLNGKNVELQLNGVPQPVTFDLLKSLPSHLLDQIMLTQVKRAEHDGASDNAIINIKTKKKYLDGFTGNIDGSYTTYRKVGWPGETNGDFFVMLMKKNFYLNISVAGENNKGRRDISDSTWYGETRTSLLSRQHIKGEKEWAAITNWNLSWDVKNDNRINANLYLFKKNEAPEFFTEVYGDHRSRSEHFRQKDERRLNLSGNIQYESGRDLPFNLKVSYGYISSTDKDQEDYQNRYEHVVPDNYGYFYKLSGRQHVFKLDAGKHFYDEKLFIGLGGKINFARLTNNIRYDPMNAVRQNEDFNYNEEVGTGFISLMYNWSEKVSLNAGIRAEYTDYHLRLGSVSLENGNHYWSWLPSLGINLNVSKRYHTSFALNSGVGRPNYNALTPKITYVSNYFYYVGNPLLKPSKAFRFEWLNTLYRQFNLSAKWGYTKDLYAGVLTDKGNEVTESAFRNCFDEWRGELGFYGSLSVMEDRLSLSLSGEWYYGKYRNFREGFKVPRNKNTGLETALNFDYWLTGNYRLKIFGNARYHLFSKSFQTDTKSYLHANVGIRYKCLANRPLYLILRGTDIFNTSRLRTTIYYGQNIRYTKDAMTWQGGQITLSYSFQGGKDLKRQEVDGDVNVDDKRFDE